MVTKTMHMTIDGDWYDSIVRAHVDEGNFESALELVRAITDGAEGLSDAERETLEMEIMNGTRRFAFAPDGMIAITDPETCER